MDQQNGGVADQWVGGCGMSTLPCISARAVPCPYPGFFLCVCVIPVCGGIVVCGVRKSTHIIPTRVPGRAGEPPQRREHEWPQRGHAGRSGGLALPAQGHGLHHFRCLRPDAVEPLPGGGAQRRRLGPRDAGRVAGPVPRQGRRHATSSFRWQPHGTISARPVTELHLQLDGCELTVLNIAPWDRPLAGAYG